MIRDGYIKRTEHGLTLFTKDGEVVASSSLSPAQSHGLITLAGELSMTLPITVTTDPVRFTEEESALSLRGLCGYQTGYGLPWSTHCTEPSNPAADFGYCTEHAEES